MTNRCLRVIVSGATFALSTMFSISAANAAEVFNMASVLPSGNFQLENAQEFSAAVEDVTDGNVSIVIHGGGALGYKGPDLLIAVRDGLVDLADIQMNQQIGEDQFFGIESLPFLATGYDDLAKLQKITRPYFDDIASKNNQMILYITPWPPQNLFSDQSVVDDLSVFSKMTIRTIDKNADEFFSALGAATVQMPWGEVIPALASGAVNSVSTSSTSAVDGAFWEFMDQYNQLQWQMNSQMVTINLDAWNRIKPEYQEAILTVADEMEEEFWATSVAEDASNIATLEEHGMSTNIPSEEVKSQLREIGKGFWDAYADEVGARAKDVLEAYK